MLRLFVPAVFLNLCISNTCVMSCLLPVIDKWSKEIGPQRCRQRCRQWWPRWWSRWCQRWWPQWWWWVLEWS